ncbi:hypothetical protein [Actinophytocola sp.]|uniref:hypothetical protein n=1 Tax=Actinophytocola sp. TaxID=1872138 RepID=UPI002ED43FF8
MIEAGRQSSYLQHVSIHVLVWSNLTLAPLSFVAHESVELVTIYLVLYLFSLVFIFPFMIHTRRATCFHCMRRFPANPSAEVEERIWWLNAWHHLFSSWKPLAGLILGYVLGSLIFAGLGVPTLVMSSFGALYCLLFASVWVSMKWHTRLGPWCPTCKGKGDHEVIVEPSPPLPEGTKNV